jgi:2-dehydro-3-deoxyphosphogluconate aldolase/(4S)-4-hydroxy-2-oxoglutarate aldolase
MARAIAAGGIHLIEITWTSEAAGQLIAELQTELPTCVIGTGTVLNATHLREAIAAGAQFCFTPHTNVELIHRAVEQQVPIIPGALSPTEIVTAWQAGAASVKVFPVEAVGGASYIRSLQGPLGHIPLIPTGGVTLHNARDFIAAGAIAVGLSSQLFPKQAITAGNWAMITHQAQMLRQNVAIQIPSVKRAGQ